MASAAYTALNHHSLEIFYMLLLGIYTIATSDYVEQCVSVQSSPYAACLEIEYFYENIRLNILGGGETDPLEAH